MNRPPENRSATRVLDTLGELCPVPIIRAAEAMKEMEPGDVLELVGDDPGIAPDIEAWCRSHRQKLLSVERKGGTIRARVQKSG